VEGLQPTGRRPGPQGLSVFLDGGVGAVPVYLSTSRDRFDLIDGAEVTIGPWRAA